MPDTKWYYAQSGQRVGPIALDELRRLASCGQITPSDLVWHQGLPQWIPAHNVPLLFPSVQESPGSPPLPAAYQGGTSGSRPAAGGKNVVEGATGFTSRMISQGSEHLRLNFATALPRVVRNASSSFHALAAHPLLISFYTIAFLVAACMSLIGIVTAILFPMFIMGYLVIIKQHLSGQPVSMAEFIGFMRHGWNSLWHLFMLLASFLVTLSLMVTPFLMASLLLFYVVGTGAVLLGPGASSNNQTISHSPMSDMNSRSMDRMAKSGGGQDRPGFLSSIVGSAVASVLRIGATAFLVLLLAPFFTAVALFFYLVFDSAAGKLSSGNSFDLVYESFGRTLLIGKTRWPELVLSGLVLAGLCILVPVATALLGSLFQRVLAPALASWLVVVVTSLGMVGGMVYGNLFTATMCIGWRRDIEQAT